jgi:heptosyltransferase I
MNRILVLRLSALGDVIHTIPAVAALRAALPESDISWVVEGPYAELVGIVAGVRAVPVRLKRWSRRPMQFRRDMRGALKAIRGCDVAIDFQGLVKSAGVGWLSRAPQRFGFDADAIRERAALMFINRPVTVDRARHVVEWNMQLAEEIAGQTGLSVLHGSWSSFPDDPAGKLSHLKGRIVLLPGAGKPEKQWPSQRFRQLVDRYGEAVVVAWGPGEKTLAESIGGPIAPETNLRELAWLLANASAVVGGDTGPLHLAAALGTRVVGLYGPTDPRRNGPYGQLDRVIDHFSGSRTMRSIGVDEVVSCLDDTDIK